MCLRALTKKKDVKKLLKDVGREGLKVYKVAMLSVDEDHYRAPYEYVRYEDGLNEARVAKMSGFSSRTPVYYSGFHFFKTRAAANRLRLHMQDGREKERYRVIECIVKKSWVTDMGVEIGYDNDGEINTEKTEFVIVAKKAIFPNYPERKIK